jgi:hypothetical protein
MAEVGDRLPKTPPEVYAREQILLHEKQQTEIVVQALRIGDIGIATTPNETYAITGLKIKAASPLPHNMVIELANGGDGYIPPPEHAPVRRLQHLGGTFRRSRGHGGAEDHAGGHRLLETVSKAPRKPWALSAGPATKAISALKPFAYWRLNEFTGPLARRGECPSLPGRPTGDCNPDSINPGPQSRKLVLWRSQRQRGQLGGAPRRIRRVRPFAGRGGGGSMAGNRQGTRFPRRAP